MVAVTVDAGWREDGGEPVQELESGKTQRGTAGGVGSREEIEDLVGATAHEVESVEGEGRPSTVADEPFQSGTVGGLDTDAPVQTKPTAVIPSEHVFGLVGF
jgi:hypothetical protein